MQHRTRERLERLGVVVVIALLLGVLVQSVRIARHQRGLRLELGRVSVTRISERTQERLDSLRDQVFVTYYVTARGRMPSHLKRLEREVTDFLQSLADASGGKLTFQVVDPESDDVGSQDLEAYAARRRVSPFPVRSVSHDAYTEETIYSSLTIAYGAHAPTQINGLTLEHMPRLQRLFVEQVDQMERPRQPVVAIAPRTGFAELHKSLSESAQVVRVDLDAQQALPARALEADALFWIDPREVTPEMLLSLNQYLQSGRSLVVAGAEYTPRIEARGPAAAPTLELIPTGYPASELLSEFGLRPIEALVGDKFHEALPLGPGAAGSLPAPFQVRCIAPNQDFHDLQNQPNGNLLFYTPTAFQLDDERLEERAFSAQVLATTSDDTWTLPLPDAPLPLSQTAREHGELAPKLPLMALLRPDDPWQGMVFALAASTAFQDGMFERPEGGVAHWRLLRTLSDNLFSDERLVMCRVGGDQASPLPPLSASARLGWRLICVGLLPLLFALLAVRRGLLQPQRRTREGRATGKLGGRSARTLATCAAGALIVVLTSALAGGLGLHQDLTADRIHELAPETVAIAADARAIDVEFVFSAHDRLPPDMRQPVRALRARLRDFERAGADLSVSVVAPQDLTAQELATLAESGIVPVKVVTEDETHKTVRNVYAALRFTNGTRSEVLQFSGTRSFEDLEFRIAFALWRLQTEQRPRVGFAPDVPRASSAEAYEYYQMQNLFSPMGHNVNSLAMEHLEELGFEVVFVNPRTHPDELPPDLDALIWIQPRRNVTKLMDLAVEYLHGGGKLLLAAQHFRMQARQYRGRNYDTVYWPQPQSPDVDLYFFPELGVKMVREVLFDELVTPMIQPLRIMGRGATRLFEPRELTQHTQLRVPASNFNPRSNLTRGLGDQAFIWANYLALDEERLAQLGIAHEVLMTTSERSWSFDWKGGWLPNEFVTGAPGASLRVHALDQNTPGTGRPAEVPYGPHSMASYSGALWDVVHSPAGQLLASAGEDRVVRLWDTQTSQQVGVLGGRAREDGPGLEGHSGGVRRLSFLPGSERLLSAGADGALILWELSTQRERARLVERSQGAATALVSDPRGELAALATVDGAVRILRTDPASAQEPLALAGHTGVVLALAFAPDGRLLAGGGQDGSVHLWDAHSGALQRSIAASTGALPGWIRCLDFAPDGRLAVGTAEGRVLVYAPGSTEPELELEQPGDWVRDLAFDPEGERLAVALGYRADEAGRAPPEAGATLRILDASSGAELRAMRDHGAFVRALAWDASGGRLAVAEGFEGDARGREPEDARGNEPATSLPQALPRPEAVLGRLPLAALFEGQFPLPEEFFWEPPRSQVAPPDQVQAGPLGPTPPEDVPGPEELAQRARRAAIVPAPGRLMFLACSQLFWNDRFPDPAYRADHLLLNAVAELTLPSGLARVAGRRPVTRGFDWVEPATRLRWRAGVLALGPLGLCLFGVLRSLWRRRPMDLQGP